MPSVLCLNDQGGSVMECSENVSGTLRAQEHGHQPLVYENHGIDARYTGPHQVAPTMSARYGTGGNNVPLVEQEETFCITGNAIDRQPQNGGNGIGYQRDIAYTLTATDHHAVYSRQRVDDFRENGVVSTQSARQHKDATDLVCQKAEAYAYLIRRLTPLECERLQGFPDSWTDIPGASDSARYKALGNSVAIPCVEFIMSPSGGIAALVVLLPFRIASSLSLVNSFPSLLPVCFACKIKERSRPMEGKKNLCAMIPAELHARIMAEKEEMKLGTLAEYVERIFAEHFEGGNDMQTERTLAVKISAELFDRLKEYLEKNHLKQKDFITQLLQQALDNAEE